MFILTKKEDNVILEMAQELGKQSNGNYLLDPTGEPDMGRLAIPNDGNVLVYEVEEIPSVIDGKIVTIEPYKYCYTEEDGFYKNPNYKKFYSVEEQLEAVQNMINEIILGEE